MLILSWNVAGLSKTVQRIHESSSHETTKRNQSSSNASLDEFFQRHHADIVCLQEHKIPKAQLKNRSEPRQCSTLSHYESFWACSTNATNMNFGVVTYCKQGCVLRADAAPLDCPELDEQGRCIMTDHGSFVLFNVYVPASGGQPLAFKMKFLRALQRAMERQRQLRKVPVILVGDLNIALDSKDIYWKDRAVYIDPILTQTADDATTTVMPKWKRDILTHWPTIAAALESKEVVPATTTNTHTGEQFSKFRLAVTVGDRRIYLGRHESTADYCLYGYDFDEVHYFDEELEQSLLAQEKNVVRLQVLAELMSRIANVQWSDETLREIATEATIRQIAPTRQWLRDLLKDGAMVDAFRYFYPDAEARFTCWHQFTNRRYCNDGSRIDATLVDAALLPHVQKGDVESLRCGEASAKVDDPLGEQAALEAATANGRFEAVSFEGGGIQDVSKAALETMYGCAHTGMIYTPPSFSDHIAISLLMDDGILHHDLQLQADAATRKSQPHKLQKSIAGCFASVASNSTTTTRNPQPLHRLAMPIAARPVAAKRKAASKATSKPTSTLTQHFRKAEKK